MRLFRAVAVAAGAASIAAGCASVPRAPVVTTPQFPAYLEPTVPATLDIAPGIRTQHDVAWRWLQAGDTKRAAREFQAVLRRDPAFYPAMAGLGYVMLADGSQQAAAGQFEAALARDGRYLPAWVGRAEVDVASGNDEAAIVSLGRILDLDPQRDGVASRLDLVKFRRVQALIEQGRAARTAGRVNEAREALGSALTLSPSSAMILEELATVEQDSGELGHAEELARRLVRFEPSNPGYLARLAGVLEARGNLVEAASVYARAAAIEPRDEWRTKASSLRTRAEEAALPAPVRAIPTAKSVTRADVAAFIGLRLTSLLQQAPQRPVQVATDIGGHWAARWIAPVTRAGVMGVYDNHTFQPQATVRRGDLAQIAANLLELPGASLGPDLARWRAARPRFSDLPATHVFYGPVALAVASGVLNADAAGRFDATRPATGAELVGAVDRISQLGQRR